MERPGLESGRRRRSSQAEAVVELGEAAGPVVAETVATPGHRGRSRSRRSTAPARPPPGPRGWSPGPRAGQPQTGWSFGGASGVGRPLRATIDANGTASLSAGGGGQRTNPPCPDPREPRKQEHRAHRLERRPAVGEVWDLWCADGRSYHVLMVSPRRHKWCSRAPPDREMGAAPQLPFSAATRADAPRAASTACSKDQPRPRAIARSAAFSPSFSRAAAKWPASSVSSVGGRGDPI